MVETDALLLTVADPLVTVNDDAVGNVAHTGLGNMARGPTASIAMNNLRRDNLTDDDFFI